MMGGVFERAIMSARYWWIRQTILVAIGVFYLYFGIQVLISAYRLNDPFSFVLTFFASNFIILISAALLVGFVLRMVSYHRQSKKADSQGLRGGGEPPVSTG